MNVSASDDSSDDYANISVVGGIVVGCGSCCLSAADSSSFFAVSTRERVFKYDKTAADISDIVYELLAKNNTKSQHSRLNTDLMSERFIIQIFFAISAFFTKT